LVKLESGVSAQGTGGVEPFPPGHVETYNLDMDGRAVLSDQTRFHKIGDAPAYNTFPVEIGESYGYSIFLKN